MLIVLLISELMINPARETSSKDAAVRDYVNNFSENLRAVNYE